MEAQPEFLFSDGPVPEFPAFDPSAAFYAEVAALWEIPVGQIVHVDLAGHQFPELRGRLELARAPDLPLDRRQTLALHIAKVEFSSRQIAAWSVA